MHWTIENEKYVVVKTSGVFTSEGYARMVMDILSRDFWRPGRDVLFDHRDLELSESDFATMMSAGDTHQAHDDRIGDGRAAIVFKSQADYGTGRIFENITEGNIQARLHLFLDLDQARRWLGQDD